MNIFNQGFVAVKMTYYLLITVYIGLSWSILVYLGLSWAISGHLGRFMSSIKYQVSIIRVPEDAGERKLLQFKLFRFFFFFCMTDRSYRGACAPKNAANRSRQHAGKRYQEYA